MTSKTFTSGTVIDSAWLNDVNGATYNGSAVYTPAGTGAVVTTTQAAIRSLQTGASFSAVATGTSDSLVGSFSPAILSISNGTLLCVRAGAANSTTTPVFTPNSGTIAAKTVLKFNGQALAIGDITGAGHWLLLQYDLTLDSWMLLNPNATSGGGSSSPTITQNSQSTNYTLVLGDAGKHLLHPSADTTARTFTLPANASVAFPIGTPITFVNQASAGVLTISITSDTLTLAGSGGTGSRTLAANGIATALKITSNSWIISGTGLA